MKIETFQNPRSAFLSTEKDLSIIIDYILKNNNLKKLLFYNTRDALNKPNLTEEQSLDLFGKQIKIVPKLYIDPDVQTYLLISFDDFTPNNTNPEFRNNIVHFDIVCHFDQWPLEGLQLRPYRIAAELDSMFCNRHLTGIGELQFLGASSVTLNDEFCDFCVMYQAIHGGEDKKHMLNPAQEESFVENFDEMFND